MKHILTIVGARPQFIKAAALSRAIRNGFQREVSEKVLHTGQHYDKNMSQVFFDELGMSQPDFNLNIGSGSHGWQSAEMIVGIEKVLHSEHFDCVVVYGDTNSTLAGAVAAAKLHVPVVHIEAGLRSFNMAMPEEQNRIVCDHLSSLLFAPTESAVENLRNEGFMSDKTTFPPNRKRKVYHSGDIMYDNSVFYASVADKTANILKDNSLNDNGYVLATIHRDCNTDNPERLTSVFKALLNVARSETVVLPLHPRTAKVLESNVDNDVVRELHKSQIRILPPVSYLEMTSLEHHSKMVITDSGGVQKEAYFFGKPCVILRSETEWIEIVEQGAAILADADGDAIVEAVDVLKNKNIDFVPIFGNGHAAEFILDKMLEYLK